MNHVTKDICYIGVNDHDLDLHTWFKRDPVLMKENNL